MAQVKSTNSKNTSRASNKAGDVGESEVQERFDKINEQGYVGTAVDQTPNENYTLEGVTSDKPTPETDEEAATAATEKDGDK